MPRLHARRAAVPKPWFWRVMYTVTLLEVLSGFTTADRHLKAGVLLAGIGVALPVAVLGQVILLGAPRRWVWRTLVVLQVLVLMAFTVRACLHPISTWLLLVPIAGLTALRAPTVRPYYLQSPSAG